MTDGLFDRDVLCKLIAAGLWSQSLEVLGLERAYRLPSARAKTMLKDLTGGRRDRNPLPPDLLERVEGQLSAIADALPTIGALNPDPAMIDRLQQYAEIDSGEAELLALLEDRPEAFVLVSGDKRCFAALAAHEPELFARVAPRLISLERCLLRLIEVRGFDTIRPALADLAALDGTVARCMGPDGTAEAASVLEGLRSYDPLTRLWR